MASVRLEGIRKIYPDQAGTVAVHGVNLDVADGEPEDFSLAAGENQHFITLSPACVASDG